MSNLTIYSNNLLYGFNLECIKFNNRMQQWINVLWSELYIMVRRAKTINVQPYKINNYTLFFFIAQNQTCNILKIHNCTCTWKLIKQNSQLTLPGI